MGARFRGSIGGDQGVQKITRSQLALIYHLGDFPFPKTPIS